MNYAYGLSQINPGHNAGKRKSADYALRLDGIIPPIKRGVCWRCRLAEQGSSEPRREAEYTLDMSHFDAITDRLLRADMIEYGLTLNPMLKEDQQC